MTNTSRHLTIALLAGVLPLSGLGCEGRGPLPSTTTTPTCSSCNLDHPVDALLAPAFGTLGLEPRLAPPAELCLRLGFDVVGRPLSPTERTSCEAAVGDGDVDAAALALQGTDDAILLGERHFADRLGSTDVIVDFRATVDLFDRVDAMHRGELAYGDFVVELLKHPGLLTNDFSLFERVDRVFRTVMFRAPNEAERLALAPLWRPWLADFEGRDPDFPIRRLHGYVVPGFCSPVAACSTSMWGGAALDFPSVTSAEAFTPIYVEDHTGPIAEALEAPGRLFAAQPAVYEAYAEHLLNRYLDWDEGERDIRTPGHLYPDVRAAVADHLQATGDVPSTERLILSSILYTQTANVDAVDGVNEDANADGASPLAVGPTKAITAEAWINTLQTLTSFDFGTCDPRFSDGFSYTLLYEAYLNGALDTAAYNDAMQQLHALRRDRGRLQASGEVDADGTELLGYDYGYTFVARQLGGCPGFGSPRQRPAGLSFALVQDAFAEALCAPALMTEVIPPGRPSIDEIGNAMVSALYQRPATGDELDVIKDFSGCDAVGSDGDCAPLNFASRLCVGLSTSAEMLFR
jgi:hypothetical protein